MALRSSRSLKALIATGIAASTIILTAVPAAASNVVRHQEWWITALGVRRAWTATQGAGVTVAVLSDGVDPHQADLVGSVTTGPDYTGTGQSSGRFFGPTGTGIASIIAGHGHAGSDAVGMIGIVPEARILSVRVTLPSNDPDLARSSVAAGLPGAITQGIYYAVKHGASVIDLPIDPGQPGVGTTSGASRAAGGSAGEKAAVEYAIAHNVVLVAPAGDNGAGSDASNFPAAYPGVIAVGAFGPGFVKAPWTSKQSYVTVTSAGANVVAASNTTGGYQVMNSTSAASAAVSGMAAMVRAEFPGLTPAQVRTALITGTVFRHSNGQATGSGSGAVNAQLALTAAETEIPASARAGAQSLPWATAAAPAPRSPRSTVTTQIIEAAAISAGLLVILLLLIMSYVVMSRRRAARKQQAITAEWAGRQGQSRYPEAASGDADRMLEYFAAPAGSQAALAQQPSHSGPQSALAARTARAARAGRTTPAVPGVLAATGRNAANRQAASRTATAAAAAAETIANGSVSTGAFGGAMLPAATSWSPDGAPRSTAVGSASRAVDRRPAVSGAPPWEPAREPNSELPWNAAPGAEQPSSWPAPSGAPAGVPPPPAAPQRSAPAPAAASIPPASIPPASTPPVSTPPVSAIPPAAAATPTSALWASPTPTATPAPPASSAPTVLPAPTATPGSPSSPSFTSPTGSAELGRPSVSGSRHARLEGWEPPSVTSRSSQNGPGVPSQSMTGRLYFDQDSDGGGTSPAPGYTPSPAQRPGDPLPVRQPRQPTKPALSPSGSLWERAVDSKPAQTTETGSGTHPIYVWNPEETGGSGSFASQSADSAAGQSGDDRGRHAEWDESEWPGSASR